MFVQYAYFLKLKMSVYNIFLEQCLETALDFFKRS